MSENTLSLLLPASLFPLSSTPTTIQTFFPSGSTIEIQDDYHLIRTISHHTFDVVLIPASYLPYLQEPYQLAYQVHLFTKKGWYRLIPLSKSEKRGPYRFIVVRTRWSSGYSLLAGQYDSFVPIFRTREQILQGNIPGTATDVLLDWHQQDIPWHATPELLDGLWYQRMGYEVPAYLMVVKRGYSDTITNHEWIGTGFKRMREHFKWPGLHIVSFVTNPEYYEHCHIFFTTLEDKGVLPSVLSSLVSLSGPSGIGSLMR